MLDSFSARGIRELYPETCRPALKESDRGRCPCRTGPAAPASGCEPRPHCPGVGWSRGGSDAGCHPPAACRAGRAFGQRCLHPGCTRRNRQADRFSCPMRPVDPDRRSRLTPAAPRWPWLKPASTATVRVNIVTYPGAYLAIDNPWASGACVPMLQRSPPRPGCAARRPQPPGTRGGQTARAGLPGRTVQITDDADRAGVRPAQHAVEPAHLGSGGPGAEI